MEKIAIFGGTFNPPHLGHRRLALAAADAVKADRVLIIPDSTPPHKQPAELIPGSDRAEMCRLGMLCDSRFEVSTVELERGKKSYTVETLRELEKLYPDGEFYLIIGSDMLSSFTQWYLWEEILERAFVVAASREKGFCPDLGAFTDEQRKRIIFIELEPFEMSSTEVRRAMKENLPADSFLHPEVARYIRENALYADRFPEWRRLIESRLDDARIYHSVCVSRAARHLALRYAADAEKAELAGLLHDVMKNEPPESQKELIERGGHKIEGWETQKVWHAMAGEAYLRLEKGITDAEILSAVRYHTTGRAGMTLMDKIVYLADFISDDRVYPDVNTVRELAEESLEKAIAYTCAYTIRTLIQRGSPIHTDTVECYNQIILELERMK